MVKTLKVASMTSDRISSRLPVYLLNHVNKVVGILGLYETPSEYLRDLIKRDAESERYRALDQISEGIDDIENGQYTELTGDWNQDKRQILGAKE